VIITGNLQGDDVTKVVNKAAIYAAAKELSNWGRWGPDDQIGTLNNVTPQDVIDAGQS
jgi:hypothetical protein